MTSPDRPRPGHAPGIAVDSLVPGAAGHISGVAFHSARVLPGDLYVALPGAKAHGAQFVADAVAQGAVAVLTDAAGAALAADAGVPVAVVPDPRAAMAEVAASVYGHPTRALELYGVTGTNGKTTTAVFLEAALTALGRHVATIGTLGFTVGGAVLDAVRSTITTPESPDLQALLALMVERGADCVAMEVSSHALALHRTDAVGFDVAGFTMLGDDHQEFHRTTTAYFEAKSRLFLGGSCRIAVVNIDDPYGRRLADLVRADGRPKLVTTSASGANADYRLTAVRARADGGTVSTLAYPGGTLDVELAMIGDFNGANALTALAMIGAQGHDVAVAAAGLAGVVVPGRMQPVVLGAGAPHVLVDFAHTPQAIASALGGVPRGGRRIAVLGAGGDRATDKRGPMGAAAARGADFVVVTDDNPRSEDPASIRRAVLDGARAALAADGRDPGLAVDGGDREAAVAWALGQAGPGDWVVVLGKGHERGQEIAGEVQPFDDVEVVQRTWRERG